MDFTLRKKQVLQKDKSVKKSIDDPIASLCHTLNNSNRFYTTSSCSGRICLALSSQSKNKDSWLYVTHYQTTFEDIRSQVRLFPHTQLWFRFESFILHICCKTLTDVEELLKIARLCGLKKASLLQVTEPYLVEIQYLPPIHIPFALDGEMVVSDSYIQDILLIANEKLSLTHAKIDEFETMIKNTL